MKRKMLLAIVILDFGLCAFAQEVLAIEEPAIEEPGPLPLLSAPENLRPAGGYRVGIEELRAGQKIDFGWAAVPGANNYIFTIYHQSVEQQSAGDQRQIIRRELGNRTSFTLDDLTVLDRGTLIWQVEAVNGQDGAILQRGRLAESSLIVDFPLPARPTLKLEEQRTETGAPRAN